MLRDRTVHARIGVLLYDGVEPIDVGGTIGVVSMARRMLPSLDYVAIARTAGPVTLAGGLVVQAEYDLDDAPHCDVLMVCGGPGWADAARDEALLAFLHRQPPTSLASVCTGALVLAAAGVLKGRAATTRRHTVGAETRSPLELLAEISPSTSTHEALVVDDSTVTGGGVSLAIDTTLYLIGRLYGGAARNDVAALIEYDRASAANRSALDA
ncbi:MAG TPA: DJ-1/PfpI family protein [Acidisphaera sp.]|nr:DJ-1/PfpI family protein [Acidisphaera sp.]